MSSEPFWAVLSGVVTAISSMYSSAAFLAWLSLIPYFIMLYRCTESGTEKKHLFWFGFLFGCSYNIPLFSFFYTL